MVMHSILAHAFRRRPESRIGVARSIFRKKDSGNGILSPHCFRREAILNFPLFES
jgi:hypothetical protein